VFRQEKEGQQQDGGSRSGTEPGKPNAKRMMAAKGRDELCFDLRAGFAWLNRR
jgi:hypothetical protein